MTAAAEPRHFARISGAIDEVVAIARLAAATLRRAVTRPFGLRELIRQIEAIGLTSLSIVVLTAIFSSMVMTVQFAIQLARGVETTPGLPVVIWKSRCRCAITTASGDV